MLFAQTSPWTTPLASRTCTHLSLRFYWWLLKLFTAWHQIIFANWSTDKEINWIFPQIQRKSYAWGSKRQADTPNTWWQSILLCGPKDGPTYLAKYPALTLCQILNAMWKHIFWNKLLICSSVFVSFIVLFITYYYFISFLNLSTSCKFYSFLVFLFNLL